MTPGEALRAWDLLPRSLAPHGNGHIHGTWRVETGSQQFLLQRINQSVFPHWERLVQNQQAVERRFRERAPGFVPTWIPTNDGGSVHVAAEGSVWRLMYWIDHHTCLDRVDQPQQAQAIGAAFGRFQRVVAGIEEEIAPAIDGFLDLDLRMQDFDVALATGDPRRLQQARAALRRVESLRPEVESRFPVGAAVVHGDCKVNNVLLGADGAALAVVDLDTVMIAAPSLDFGDLARSACALSAEDDSKASSNALRQDLFLGIAAGYAQELGPDALEPQVLVDASLGMSFMLASRFLADYLTGDRYFSALRPGHNLDRALAQIALAAAFLAVRDELADGLGSMFEDIARL